MSSDPAARPPLADAYRELEERLAEEARATYDPAQGLAEIMRRVPSEIMSQDVDTQSAPSTPDQDLEVRASQKMQKLRNGLFAHYGWSFDTVDILVFDRMRAQKGAEEFLRILDKFSWFLTNEFHAVAQMRAQAKSPDDLFRLFDEFLQSYPDDGSQASRSIEWASKARELRAAIDNEVIFYNSVADEISTLVKRLCSLSSFSIDEMRRLLHIFDATRAEVARAAGTEMQSVPAAEHLRAMLHDFNFTPHDADLAVELSVELRADLNAALTELATRLRHAGNTEIRHAVEVAVAWRRTMPGPGAAASFLQGVDLAGVDLAGVDLAGVDLTEANLSGASLAGTDLTGTNLTGTRLAGAVWTETTEWPESHVQRIRRESKENPPGVFHVRGDSGGGNYKPSRMPAC